MSCRWTCTPSGGAPSAAWSPSPCWPWSAPLVFSPWLWTAQVVLDLAVVGYVLVLRKVARRERLAARRAARAAAREALRTPSRAGPAVALVARRSCTRPSRPSDLPHPSVPLAPVHPLRPGRVVAARTPAPVGWQHSAVVGLDDDDIGFADIDVYQPRAGRQRLNAFPAPAPRWWRRRAGTVLSAPKGLWRSPVAHLVRIEGVRGSNPLSSTPSPHDQQTPSGPTPRRRSPSGAARDADVPVSREADSAGRARRRPYSMRHDLSSAAPPQRRDPPPRWPAHRGRLRPRAVDVPRRDHRAGVVADLQRHDPAADRPAVVPRRAGRPGRRARLVGDGAGLRRPGAGPASRCR